MLLTEVVKVPHQLCRLEKLWSPEPREIPHRRGLQDGPEGLQLGGGRPGSEIQKLSKSNKISQK